MKEHRRNIEGKRNSYFRDELDNELDSVTKQDRVGSAVAAAKSIEALNRLDEQLSEEQSGLRSLGAKARGAGRHFDGDWVRELWQLTLLHQDNKIKSQFMAFESYLRIPHLPPEEANTQLQEFADQLEKWRIRQREELAASLGVLYEQFPFFSTHILPSLLVRVAGAPPGTVVPPENQIAMGFATLLGNINEVIERIATDKIDPLNLPEAVSLAARRMQFSDLVALQELLDEKKSQEDTAFLLSLTLPFVLAMLPLLGAVAVSATGAGAAAAADAAAAIGLAGDAAAAMAGGIMFLGEARETSNRFSLEAASGSHDRSLLGVPALSGGDAMMIAINGILMAAGLFGAARGLQGYGEPRAGSGVPPPAGNSKDVNPGRTSAVPFKEKQVTKDQTSALSHHDKLQLELAERFPGGFLNETPTSAAQPRGKAAADPRDVPPAWMLEDITQGRTPPSATSAPYAEALAPPGAPSPTAVEPKATSHPEMQAARKMPDWFEPTIRSPVKRSFPSTYAPKEGDWLNFPKGSLDPAWRGRIPETGGGYSVQAGHTTPKSTGAPDRLAIELTRLNLAKESKLSIKEAIQIDGVIVERQTALELAKSGNFPDLTVELIANAPTTPGWKPPAGMAEGAARALFMSEMWRVLVAAPNHPFRPLLVSIEDMAGHIPTRPMILPVE